jgi:hypothetical protein
VSGVASTTAERTQKRLLAKRQIDPESGCWLWQGRCDRFGYGRVTIDHRRYAVHRLAAAIYLDFDLESPLQILHRCHTPGCFRPEHLRAGTHAENMRDKRLRAEQATGEPASTPTPSACS